VVAVGLTLVEPLAEVEVKEPGEIAILVAPEVVQLRVLLEPELMLVGLAVNELIVGLLELFVFTVTVTVEVVEREEFVAVSVKVVVAVGLTLVEPLAEAEVNEPGEIEIVVAPLVAQLSVVLVPEFTVVGFAVNEAIDGIEPLPGGVLTVVAVPAQLHKPKQTSTMSRSAQKSKREEWRPRNL